MANQVIHSLISSLNSNLADVETYMKPKFASASVISDCFTASSGRGYCYNTSTANTPVSGTFGMIQCLADNSGQWKILIAYDTKGRVFVNRNINNAGYGSWREIVIGTPKGVTQSSFTNVNSSVNISQYGMRLYESANMCVLTGGLKMSGNIDGYTALFTVPSDYKPVIETQITYVAAITGDVYTGYIDANGVVHTRTAIPSGKDLFFSVTYIHDYDS